MKPTMLLGVLLLAALAGPAHAIYKCVTPKGVVYQDRPCSEGNEADLRLVIPSGQLAPKNQAGPETGSVGAATRNEARLGAAKTGLAGKEDSPSTTKSADNRANDAAASTKTTEITANANSGNRGKDASPSADNSGVGAPPAVQQARNAEPSAKYYTTEGFSAGAETPAHMTCESANGEKRVFYLSNGKLTSI